jgi:pterin-4a-carbinolamine dehydratase
MASQIIAEKKASCASWPLIEDEAVLREKTAEIPNWELFQTDAGVYKLSRSFTAKGFQAALDFIAKAGAVAEQVC